MTTAEFFALWRTVPVGIAWDSVENTPVRDAWSAMTDHERETITEAARDVMATFRDVWTSLFGSPAHPRGHHAPVAGFRPNAPRRRMRTPGGRIVRRVMR